MEHMMTNKIKNADGTKGVLIYTGETFMFRVYDKDLNFVDYDIRHYDLQVTIDDCDAYFYDYEDDTHYLDYGTKTLYGDKDET